MQINRNSDIVYYNEDGKSLSYFEYKKGDYISDDELYKLFSYFYGRIHSTGGNFYMLELAMRNKNKNNKRFIIADKMFHGYQYYHHFEYPSPFTILYNIRIVYFFPMKYL
jgi:hypothetical protein